MKFSFDCLLSEAGCTGIEDAFAVFNIQRASSDEEEESDAESVDNGSEIVGSNFSEE